MKVDVYFSPSEAEPGAVDGATVVVIDVVRATTTIVEALANGAGPIYPTASTEDAVKLASSLGREDTLLCGERKGVKVEGFDLGNSPAEFTPEAVDGMKLVMSTTNGTRALIAGGEAETLVVCAFTNLGAVARAVVGAGRLVILCAGREDRFSLDDALCAGHLVRRLGDLVDGDLSLDDAALAVRTLAGRNEPTRSYLSRTAAGRSLEAIGLQDDLAVCAEVDRHDIVPTMRDQRITATGA